ncbi:MAG: putative RND superfamily exporter protein [Paracoccaceae bacterium]|jgi:predicted RND superfamily exporter protein
MGSGLMSLYEKLVMKRPVLVLLLVVAVIGALASFLPNLKLDASSDSLVLEGDNSLKFYREINKRFATEEFLLVVYRPNGELMSDHTLSELAKLRDELATMPMVSSVVSILDVPLLDSPRVSLTEVAAGKIPMLKNKGTDRGLALKELSTSPLYESLLTSPDGTTTGIQVNIKRDAKYARLLEHRESLKEKQAAEGLSAVQQRELEVVEAEFLAYLPQTQAAMTKLVAQTRAILAKYRDSATLYLGGVPMIAADMISFVQSDLVVFGAGIIAFIVVLLVFIFRSVIWTLLPLATCILSALFMLGLLSFLDWRMTVISSNFVALLLIITLSISIHLVVRYRELAANNIDWDQRQLVHETVRVMAKPCFYTALTTLVAFMSLVVSGIRPVIDFGWMMTIGVSVALVLTFLVVPCVLLLIKSPIRAADVDNSKGFTLKFAALAEKQPTAIMLVALALLTVSLWGVSQLKVENRFIDYFDEGTEIYQGMEIIDEKLGGTIPLDIIINAPQKSAEPAVDSEFSDDFGDDFGSSAAKSSHWFTIAGLERIKSVHDYVDGLDETGKVLSLATPYELVKMIMGNDVDDLQLALVKRSLPDDIKDIVVTPYLAAETDQARISIRVMETSHTLKRDQLLKDIHKHLINDMGFADDQVQLTGMLVLYNNMLQSLFRSQILTLSAVFVAILAMFLVLFRSLRLALIALAPNVLAAGAVLGGMGLFGIPLDMMTITIAAITVGIGVDHAIHYVHRFKIEFPKDRDYIATMYRCHGSIGKAMYYTSVIIIFGFSILALSNFTPSIYFGLLTGAAMLAALLGSMLLLPRLIISFKPLGK